MLKPCHAKDPRCSPADVRRGSQRAPNERLAADHFTTVSDHVRRQRHGTVCRRLCQRRGATRVASHGTTDRVDIVLGCTLATLTS